MQDLKDHLSITLKRLRKDRAWSLDTAAAATGVSKAMLGQIERGESSPTTAVLWKLATGFKVSVSSLMEPIPEVAMDTLIRDADALRNTPGDKGMAVAPLFPFESRFGFDYMELTFYPGYERLSEPHEPGVIEHITVISGQMEILADDTWHQLKEGQSIRFRGDSPHGYRNSGNEKAVTLSVIHYPYRT
ncbi:helix-turn-helix domain-containing protein [Sneathiella litorea]|uniref:Helix-turn-helix domain-containing protein n=1 Tax=Sneathiella litorea TaxID=2606216 RepID=A0A6L8W3K4_9PROT|nr:XRE family transcriptional regulator [Sneathiella litorea]MZR29122.1 helix-turn-helix domain-containing protein [Sneathiella litorea]